MVTRSGRSRAAAMAATVRATRPGAVLVAAKDEAGKKVQSPVGPRRALTSSTTGRVQALRRATVVAPRLLV